MTLACVRNGDGSFQPPYDLLDTSVDGQYFATPESITNNEMWLNNRSIYLYSEGAPPSINGWEVRLNDSIILSGGKATRTYTVQDKAKADIYGEKFEELLALRETKLAGGFEASSGNVFVSETYDLIKLLSAIAALNAGEISEVGGDLSNFRVWKTDGTFRLIDTEAELKVAAKKLYNWLRDIEDCVFSHNTNMQNLRDNIDGAWEGTYTGPGHVSPYDAEDIYTYSITTGWPT